MATLVFLKGMPDSAPLVALVEDTRHLLATVRSMVEEDGLGEASGWGDESIASETEGLDDAGIVAWWCSGNAEDAQRLRSFEGGELVVGDNGGGSVLSLVQVTVNAVTKVPWPSLLAQSA